MFPVKDRIWGRSLDLIWQSNSSDYSNAGSFWYQSSAFINSTFFFFFNKQHLTHAYGFSRHVDDHGL